MSLSRTSTILTLSAGVLAVALLFQQHSIQSLRKENSLLRTQDEQLALMRQENQDLSNRLVEASMTQATPIAPSPELLRLRGEVGVLRRQLSELRGSTQSHAQMSPPEATAAGETNSPSLDSETLRRLEGVRIENEARLLREETLLKELQAMPKETLTKVLPTAITDSLLNELLQQLNLLEQAKISLQQNAADGDSSALTLARQIESVERKIAERTEGILKGMEVRITSLKAQLDSLSSSVENAKKLK